MEDVKYSKPDALKIAYDFHMKGALDDLVNPKSKLTVRSGLDGFMGVGGYGNTPEGRERIWKEMMELPLGNGLTKENYTAQELSEMLKPKGVSIDPAAIDKVGEELKLGTFAPAEKPQEPKPSPQAAVEDKPKVQTPAAADEKPKDAILSAPPASAPTSGDGVAEEGGFWGYFKNLGKRIDNSREGQIGNDVHKGGFMDIVQRFFISLLYMLGDGTKAGLGNKDTEQNTAPKKQEVQQEQKQQCEQLTQQAQVAQEATKAQEAEKVAEIAQQSEKAKKSEPPPRDIIRDLSLAKEQNPEMKDYIARLSEASHVPNDKIVSPSSCPKHNSVAQSHSTDFGMGRSLR